MRKKRNNNLSSNKLNKDFFSSIKLTLNYSIKSEVLYVFNEIFKLISRKNKIFLFINFLIMLVTAFLELFSLISVVPLLISISNPSDLDKYKIIGKLINFFPIINENNFFNYAYLFIVIIALFSALMRIYNLWISEFLAAEIGSELSCKAYGKVLRQNYSFHIKTKSSSLIAALTDHVSGLTLVLRSVLRLFISIILVIILLVGLLFISKDLTFIIFGFFAFIYILFSALTKNTLSFQGKVAAKEIKSQIKYVQDGIGSIKEIILADKQATFLDKYKKADLPLRKSLAKSQFIAYSPKFGIEGMAIISIVFLTIFLKSFYENQINILTVVGTVGLASQKLLPAMQQIFNSWALIKSNFESVEILLKILNLKDNFNLQPPNIKIAEFKENIEFNNVCFSYSKDSKNIINNLSLKIHPGEKIAIIGETGSGKSTLIDLLMGLLKPTSGEIIMDGIDMNANPNKKIFSSWKKKIGLVPQDIFLIDGSFSENISLENNLEKRNYQTIYEASEHARISKFILSTKHKYETEVGERGINISGGQKQRIGIARALYKKPSILILDEATSALDQSTEKKVMSSISKYYKNLTIIMIAHRLSTVSICDKVLLLDKGSILKYGSPKEILTKN